MLVATVCSEYNLSGGDRNIHAYAVDICGAFGICDTRMHKRRGEDQQIEPTNHACEDFFLIPQMWHACEDSDGVSASPRGSAQSIPGPTPWNNRMPKSNRTMEAISSRSGTHP
jgi:hypothetical protein